MKIEGGWESIDAQVAFRLGLPNEECTGVVFSYFNGRQHQSVMNMEELLDFHAAVVSAQSTGDGEKPPLAKKAKKDNQPATSPLGEGEKMLTVSYHRDAQNKKVHVQTIAPVAVAVVNNKQQQKLDSDKKLEGDTDAIKKHRKELFQPYNTNNASGKPTPARLSRELRFRT